MLDTYNEVLAKQRIRSKNYYWKNRELLLSNQKAKKDTNPVKKKRRHITESEYRDIKRQREIEHYYKHRERIRKNSLKTSKPKTSSRRQSNVKPIPFFLPPLEKRKISITITFD